MTQKPPSCSFVSANGPSVVSDLAVLRETRTVVAVLGRVQAAGEDPDAAGLDLVVEGVDVAVDLLHDLRRRRLAPSTMCTDSRYCVMLLLLVAGIGTVPSLTPSTNERDAESTALDNSSSRG